MVALCRHNTKPSEKKEMVHDNENSQDTLLLNYHLINNNQLHHAKKLNARERYCIKILQWFVIGVEQYLQPSSNCYNWFKTQVFSKQNISHYVAFN